MIAAAREVPDVAIGTGRHRGFSAVRSRTCSTVRSGEACRIHRRASKGAIFSQRVAGAQSIPPTEIVGD